MAVLPSPEVLDVEVEKKSAVACAGACCRWSFAGWMCSGRTASGGASILVNCRSIV
ncbi:hypothetical protein WME98_36740 [Sorangium sp. So ce296]|uniref:hypothetical protein n=1 Tax=Sorangium sp. So ce296 TaxID=3133296 RepID=UPI003F618B63